VAYLGAIVALIGVAWLLAQAGMPTWLAFLLVGVITIAIGAFVGLRAFQQMKKLEIVPPRTVETVRQDVEWAKEQTR